MLHFDFGSLLLGHLSKERRMQEACVKSTSLNSELRSSFFIISIQPHEDSSRLGLLPHGWIYPGDAKGAGVYWLGSSWTTSWTRGPRVKQTSRVERKATGRRRGTLVSLSLLLCPPTFTKYVRNQRLKARFIISSTSTGKYPSVFIQLLSPDKQKNISKSPLLPTSWNQRKNVN